MSAGINILAARAARSLPRPPRGSGNRNRNAGALAAELYRRVSAKPDRMRRARCLPLRDSKPWLNISTFWDPFVSDPLHTVAVVGIYVWFSVTADNLLFPPPTLRDGRRRRV